MVPIKSGAFATLLVLAMASSSEATFAHTPRGEGLPLAVAEAEDLRVGQVLQAGRSTAAGPCEFNFELMHSGPDPITVVLDPDEKCDLKVDSVESTFANSNSDENAETTSKECGISDCGPGPLLSQTYRITMKTTGCCGNDVTKVTHTQNWDYTGSYAYGNWHQTSYWWHSGYGWVRDSYNSWWVYTQGSYTQSEAYADYHHCNIVNQCGWYHTLHGYVQGGGGGNGLCSGHYHGSIEGQYSQSCGYV